MTPELKDKIAKLKELAGKIPQVEWYNLAVGNKEYAVFAKTKPEAIVTVTYTDEYGTKIGLGKNTAEFIAVVNPVTILELIAEIEVLEKEADWLAEAANEIGEHDEADIAWWREKARKAVREGK